MSQTQLLIFQTGYISVAFCIKKWQKVASILKSSLLPTANSSLHLAQKRQFLAQMPDFMSGVGRPNSWPFLYAP